MATYKVLQDIEAEDKLLGPLTLRQFIYASIAGIFIYLSFLSITKHAAFLLVIFLPIILFAGFFAWPWSLNQTTEVWALGKIRFFLKPHRRIWDQTGVKDLVTVTVPKTINIEYTDGLSQTEVKSRLKALADTLDTRGWAIKNADLNTFSRPVQFGTQTNDRLLDINQLPTINPVNDTQASDDILDERSNPVAHHFEELITASSQNRRQHIVDELQSAGIPKQPAPTPADNNYWFADKNQAPPTQDEKILTEELKDLQAQPEIAYANLHTLSVPSAPVVPVPTLDPPKTSVTAPDSSGILQLGSNNDLNVATIARQANKDKDSSQDEVVVNLH
ncbi:MAG TPA: PrgI family protein [Candidatus Saccharimonadales bacterium]|jgi:hypothetical protein|nr:PrgI family protein [Candidatus Saccharimonadales bacterium]